MDSVAIVAVIFAGAVSLASLGVTAWTAQQTRRHERSLKRQERNYDARRDLYIEICAFFSRLRLFAERTEPILTPAPEPPEIPDDEEWAFRMDATTSVFGSEQMNAAVRECQVAFRDWQFSGVGVFRAIRDQRSVGHPEVIEARRTMDTLRQRFVERVENVNATARADLQGGPLALS